jgi:hypothetical protein
VNEPTTDRPTYPPSSLRYRVGVTIAVLVAITALVIAIRSTKSTDENPVVVNGRPDVVEHVMPRDGVEALQQAEIGIDLATGYEGGLSLNGVAIPTKELRIVPPQNQVFFAPGPGLTFEALPSGKNCVTATVWKTSDGPGTPSDLSFQWCFDVL